MSVEINRKKDQKIQNNISKLEDFDPNYSINPIVTESKEEKSLLSVLGISVSFLEFSNKNSLLDLTLELENTRYNELDSEFKTILKQEFINTILKEKKLDLKMR